MTRLRFTIQMLLIGSLLTAGWTCGGPTGPDTGQLEVLVGGFPPRYIGDLALVVAGESHDFVDYDPSPRLVLTGLPPGDLSVALEGLPVRVAADCRAPDGTERTATIAAGTRTSLSFGLQCTWGRLRVSTTTTGLDPDSDGYVVELTAVCAEEGYYGYQYECDAATVSVPSTGSVVAHVATTMLWHSYSVALAGVSGNCTATGPESFGYPAQDEIAFDITCARASG